MFEPNKSVRLENINNIYQWGYPTPITSYLAPFLWIKIAQVKDIVKLRLVKLLMDVVDMHICNNKAELIDSITLIHYLIVLQLLLCLVNPSILESSKVFNLQLKMDKV